MSASSPKDTPPVPVGSTSEGVEFRTLPFLRWAGGKRWLIPLLHEHAPQSYERFVEPFLGSGAVLLSVSKDIPREASDLNAELINAFEVVRDKAEELLEMLSQQGFGLAEYLHARARFNDLKANQSSSAVERAALFVYLNKTSFNGLYRENLSGEFNVPWGKKHEAPRNLEQTVRNASQNLRGESGRSNNPVKFSVADYRTALRRAGPGDWVYLDPPYMPASTTANFVGYTSAGFDLEQQALLRDEALAAAERGSKVLLSNADLPSVRNLYQDGPWRLSEILVTRSVGANEKTRKRVGELLVKNYD